MMEKVKDAVGMNKHDNTHDNTHGAHGSHSTTGTGSGLNTLSSGQNTTSTGLTGSSGHSTGQGIGGHDNVSVCSAPRESSTDVQHATQNTAAALGAGSLAGGNHNVSILHFQGIYSAYHLQQC